jgi:hypothetical protein
MGIKVGDTNEEVEEDEADSSEAEVNPVISYRMEIGGRTTIMCPFSQNMEFFMVKKDGSQDEIFMGESSRIEVLYDSLVIDDICKT